MTIVASKRRQAETRPVVDGTSFKRSNSSSSVTQQGKKLIVRQKLKNIKDIACDLRIRG